MNQQMQIGQFLKTERQKKGFSQKKLAETAECSPSALCMFEKGKTDALSPERLNKICEVLGLQEGTLIASAAKCFCPNEYCPTHTFYKRPNGQQVLTPKAVEAAGGTHCNWCGEQYASTCDFCDAPFSGNGAFCPKCGAPYVAITMERVINPSDYGENFKIIQFNQNDNSRDTAGGAA